MTKLVLSVLLLATFVSEANPQEVRKDYRAEEMLNLCTGNAREIDKGSQSLICTFRMQGIMDMMVYNCMSIDSGFKPYPLLTSEKPPSRGAAKKAFLNFMDANPDKWGMPWNIVVSMALSENFPCKR